MVLEIEHQHAENTHFVVQIRILEFTQQFQDILLLDQFFKFLSYNFLASMELKIRFHPRQRKIDLMGSDMPKEEPLRGGGTSQRSRRQSHKF